MDTPQSRVIRQMWEPVYQPATHLYNASVIGRLFQSAEREALVKNDYPMRHRPGYVETIQTALARPRTNLEAVNAQMSATGTTYTPGG